MEEAIFAYAEEELGAVRRNQRRAIPNTIIRTSIDAIVVETGKPVEAKSSETYQPGDWGDPGTDQVPDRVICQTQIHMKALEQDICWVPVYLGLRRFGMYQVPRNEQLIAVLLEAAQNFWLKHVMTDIPPTDSIPSLRLIRKIIRTPNKIVVFSPDQVATYEALETAKIACKKMDTIKDACQAAVLAALGDAECAVFEDGRAMTFLESPRKGYSVPATTVRTLRVLKQLPETFKHLLEGENYGTQNDKTGESTGLALSGQAGGNAGEGSGTEGPAIS